MINEGRCARFDFLKGWQIYPNEQGIIRCIRDSQSFLIIVILIENRSRLRGSKLSALPELGSYSVNHSTLF